MLSVSVTLKLYIFREMNCNSKNKLISWNQIYKTHIGKRRLFQFDGIFHKTVKRKRQIARSFKRTAFSVKLIAIDRNTAIWRNFSWKWLQKINAKLLTSIKPTFPWNQISCNVEKKLFQFLIWRIFAKKRLISQHNSLWILKLNTALD